MWLSKIFNFPEQVLLYFEIKMREFFHENFTEQGVQKLNVLLLGDSWVGILLVKRRENKKNVQKLSFPVFYIVNQHSFILTTGGASKWSYIPSYLTKTNLLKQYWLIDWNHISSSKQSIDKKKYFRTFAFL